MSERTLGRIPQPERARLTISVLLRVIAIEIITIEYAPSPLPLYARAIS